MHIFCDTSEEAFATVAYLWTVRDGRYISSNIIMAKTRIAAKRTISVAKLELQAALLGSRIAKTLGEERTLPIHRRRLWTDSSWVRNWLRTAASYYKPFVSHHIGEIPTLTEAGKWRFIPGTQNPADWATRSIMTSEPIITTDWIEGPELFKRPEEDWPKGIPKEKTKIRIAHEGRITHQTKIKDTTYWENIEFDEAMR